MGKTGKILLTNNYKLPLLLFILEFLRILEWNRICVMINKNQRLSYMTTARQVEKIVKGFANHHRIEMLRLIKERPELSLNEVSKELRANLKTTSEHLRRLTVSGLITKQSRGQNVLHRISPLGEDILKFLRKLEE